MSLISRFLDTFSGPYNLPQLLFLQTLLCELFYLKNFFFNGIGSGVTIAATDVRQHLLSVERLRQIRSRFKEKYLSFSLFDVKNLVSSQ